MHPNALSALLQKIRRKIFLKSSGLLSSHSKGEGFDFAEISSYAPGMDARKIYWNSLAKGGELQIKSYYEEREINVVVALLLTGSLRFGQPIEKYDKLIEVAAMLGYSIIQGNNLFQGFCWSKKQAWVVPPSKSNQSVENFVQKCASIDPLYTYLDTQKAMDLLFQKIRKKSLLFIVSDFLEEIDLSKLAKKHEIIVLIIRDPFENNPTALGESILRDPESGEEIEIVFDQKAALAYQKCYTVHNQKLLHHLRILGIKHMFLYTNKETFLELSHL